MQASEDEIYNLLKHIYISEGYQGFRGYYDRFLKSLIKLDPKNFAERFRTAERAFSSIMSEHFLSTTK